LLCVFSIGTGGVALFFCRIEEMRCVIRANIGSRDQNPVRRGIGIQKCFFKEKDPDLGGFNSPGKTLVSPLINKIEF